jgi:hypothetical protein
MHFFLHAQSRFHIVSSNSASAFPRKKSTLGVVIVTEDRDLPHLSCPPYFHGTTNRYSQIVSGPQRSNL